MIQSGLFQINFRKLIDQTPTTLGTWFANTLPARRAGGEHLAPHEGDGQRLERSAASSTASSSPPRRSWTPNSRAAGSGVYNFRFDLGDVPVYFDDLTLSGQDPTPTHPVTWGQVKALYRN